MMLTAKYAKDANGWTGPIRQRRRDLVRVVGVVRGSNQGWGCAAWNLAYRTNNTTLNTFNVNGKNELTNSTPGGVATYDANGNLISSAGGALEYAYDDENRLSVVQTNILALNYPYQQTWFYYDGIGRLRLRVERIVQSLPGGGGDSSRAAGAAAAFQSGQEEASLLSGGGTVAWVTNSITEYIYDGWRVIQERDINNTPTVSYTRGTDLSGTLQGAGGIGGLLGRSTGNGTTWTTHNYYHADGNGNVTYLINSSQGLAAKYRYDPYGNTISSSGALASDNTYRFSSKELMLACGANLYYHGYRFYSPNLQRWANRDPKQEEGFAELRKVGKRGNTAVIDRSQRTGTQRNYEDLYIFAFNKPLNRYDPYGLDAPGCDTFDSASLSACQLECCAAHDKCFKDNDCSKWSWLNPVPCLFACGQCNIEVVGCWSQCTAGYSDNPDLPNYYCGQCGVYFDLQNPTDINFPENNPHYGHHTR